MKIHRLILCIFCLFLFNLAHASTSGADLQNKISSFIEAYGNELTAKGYRIEYDIGSIDPRLSVGHCSENLNIEFVRSPLEQVHNTAKLSCNNGHPWKLFVSTNIRIYGQVVISDTAIGRGQLIDISMINMKEALINRSRQALFDDPKEVVGKLAKRTIRTGQTVSPGDIKAPNLISRGDKVIITAQNNHISIKTNGTALSHGTLGQQISVRNDRSERIVKAKVVDRGRVLITM